MISMVTNPLKQFWNYMDTSHSSHSEATCPGGDGHSWNDSVEYVSVPNRTPLQRIKIAGIVLIILGGFVGNCVHEEWKRLDREDETMAERARQTYDTRPSTRSEPNYYNLSYQNPSK